MSKTNKILIALLAVVVALLFTNRTQKEKSLVLLSSQQNEGGNVTIITEPEVLKIGQPPKFKLAFNTHSIDLAFDVAKQSYLLDDAGNRFNAQKWSGSPPGGHHRDGVLTFTASLPETKYAELVITDIAGIPERRFRWNL